MLSALIWPPGPVLSSEVVHKCRAPLDLCCMYAVMHDDNQTLGWLLVLCLNSNLIPGISAAAVMTPDWLLAVSLFTTRVLVPVPSTRAPCGSGPPPRSTIFYTQQCKESFQFMKLLATLLTFITLHSEYMNQYANNRAIPIWKQCMSWSRMWRY